MDKLPLGENECFCKNIRRTTSFIVALIVFNSKNTHRIQNMSFFRVFRQFKIFQEIHTLFFNQSLKMFPTYLELVFELKVSFIFLIYFLISHETEVITANF